jgi:phage terminase small subunit
MITAKQEAFIDAYCLTGNASKAAEMAGYSPKAAKQKGYTLKNQFSYEIQEKTKKMIQDCVPGALSQLKNLVESAESESVKLGAIKDILDRAGHKPADKVEQQISHVESSSIDELKRELEALVGTSEADEIPEMLN